MPRLWTLTEQAIRGMAGAEVFARGEAYWKQGAVRRLTRRGDEVEAEVEGSGFTPYRVQVALTPAGLNSATCSCPYEWGGACKHIVATLLAVLRQPEAVESGPPLDALLASLDREQLQAVLHGLVRRLPDAADLIETEILAARAGAGKAAGTPVRHTPINPAPYRRRVAAALHSLDRMRPSEAYRHISGVVSEVLAIAAEARPFFEADDGRNALAILEAVTEEYAGAWMQLDDSSGNVSGLFAEIDPLWAEALLSTDLNLEERKTWARRFNQWAEQGESYGIDDAFGMAEAAAVQGWDGPWIEHAAEAINAEDEEEEEAGEDDWEDDYDEDLDEEDEDEDEDDEEGPGGHGNERWYARELAAIRLRILERRGRFDEYLALARATGQVPQYLTMLVRNGRIDEAVTEGLATLRSPNEALTFAQALVEHDALDAALRVGEHGLGLKPSPSPGDFRYLSPSRVALARWLRDLAFGAGQPGLARHAAEIAVQDSHDLSDYLAAESVAGDHWPAMQERLLDLLRRTRRPYGEGSVDIFLHEGLITDAMVIADAAPHDAALAEKVADAALPSHPAWVERTARAQAHPIMDEGRSGQYQDAARWVGKVRDAMRATGREDEWRAYIAGLLDKHRRKYTLTPLLKALQ
jgi:uncharacterized Zn finger protein